MTATQSGPLRGSARVPGDKSISHRALILGALAVGETRVDGLLEGDDVLATGAVLRYLVNGNTVLALLPGNGSMGVRLENGAHANTLRYNQISNNAGTGVRLMMGAVATTPITATFTGDASLCRRPMRRVIEPLEMFGAEIHAREGGRLPLTLKGARMAMPVTYRLPVASAQVKSAVLLAGLNAPGRTTVLEAEATRDHTERMLQHFGATVSREAAGGGLTAIHLEGQPELRPQHVRVPADPSSAAFPLVAALLVPGSNIRLEGVMLNPTRAGLVDVLLRMGADITIENRRGESGEDIADLVVKASSLKGVDVEPEIARLLLSRFGSAAERQTPRSSGNSSGGFRWVRIAP